MNINGLGNLYDRTNTTYRTNKNEQSFAGLLEKADGSLNSEVENESEKKDIPEEEETRTEVVVRPDGSKVLMITVTVGGQEAVTSVELAKPVRGDIPSRDISGNVDVNDIVGEDEVYNESCSNAMQVNMLVSETVQARFPLEEVNEEGNRKEDIYLIAVDKDGIHCSKPGQDEYEWEILFTDESKYEKAIEFLNYAREFMDNFRFAVHENFWEDYLNGNMDVGDFKEFLEGTNNGIPDYSFTVGDSVYIDKEKAQWAQYMNPLGARFYTAEEMAKMQAELIEKNTATLHKLSDPYSILYKKLVDPEYNGERIFCEYPGGPLYTADEIMEVMNRNLKDAKYQAEARK